MTMRAGVHTDADFAKYAKSGAGPRLRVLHVSAYFAPAFRYGGPPRSVLGLCQALIRAGVDVEVFTTTANGDDPLPPAVDGVDYQGVRARYFPLAWPRRYWRGAGLAGAVGRAGTGAHPGHVHGPWNFISRARRSCTRPRTRRPDRCRPSDRASRSSRTASKRGL